jgi:hypothetical protein
MNTLTQGKQNELKRLLRYPNDPITNDTFWHNRETLIAAAEEGLRSKAEVQRLIDETHRWSAAERKAKEDHEEDKKALRARVQELEEALKDLLPYWIEEDDVTEYGGHVACEISWNDFRKLKSVLSNSTPQPTRYTLDGWRDIKTAPRDGTFILVYGPPVDDENVWVYQCRWMDFSPLSQSGELAALGEGPRGQFEVVIRDFVHKCRPTHWMPMPPAPQQKEEA